MRDLIKKFTLHSETPDAEVESAFHGAIYYGLMGSRSPDGRTIADIWEAEAWKGLNDDELVMMRFRRRSFVTIVEIQRILGDTALKWVDLLRPSEAPFWVVVRVNEEITVDLMTAENTTWHPSAA